MDKCVLDTLKTQSVIYFSLKTAHLNIPPFLGKHNTIF